MRIGRRAAIGLAVVACAVAIGTPVALAHRTTHAADVGSVANGYQVFNDYFCVACHTMKAAGPAAYGQLGMDFNKIHSTYAISIATITNGLPAALPLYPTQMVGFGKVLTASQIQDVASFLDKYSGGYKTCSECTATPTGFPTG